MKNLKYLLLLGIIIFLSIPICGISQDDVEERDLLVGILEDLGADFVEENVDIGGVIMDEFKQLEDLEVIGDKITRELEIKKIEGDMNVKRHYWEEIVEEEGFNQLIVQGYDEEGDLITFTLSSYEDEDIAETSLFINLIKREQFVEINDIIEKVEKIFQNYNKPVNITTCIAGIFEDDMRLDEKEKMVLKGAREYRGKVIEKYRDQQVLSFSIFTPYIEQYIYTGREKMNLNIVIRYNEYENKSYIWIGTPIITIGY